MEMLGVSDLDLVSVVYPWIYIRRFRRIPSICCRIFQKWCNLSVIHD